MSIKPGAGAKTSPTCAFFKELSFLTDTVGNKATVSNVTPTTLPDLSPASPNSSFVISEPQSPNMALHHTLPDSPAAPTLVEEEVGKKGKQKTRKDMDIDMLLTRSLIQDIESNEEKKQNTEYPDELFCKSLVDSFKKLPKKKNKRAKIKVLEILLEFEDDDE